MEIGNDRIFRVRWGKGYPETEPRIVTMKEIEESNDWNLDDGFISNLKTVRIQDEFDYDLKWVDPSGEVFFKGIGSDMDNLRWYSIQMADGCSCERPAANFVELVKEVNKFMREMCYHEDEILAIDYLGVEWQATPMKENNNE
jgi:hypothetical protein